MTQDTATQKLIASLEREGIPYELNEEGTVVASDEVVAYLDSKEILGREGETVCLTKEQLLGIEEDDGEEGYTFTTIDDPSGPLEDDEIQAGDSDLVPTSGDHCTTEEYVGPIEELKGKRADVRRNVREPYRVAAQFSDERLILNDAALGFGWHDFPFDHFTDSRDPITQWRSLPSNLRAHIRKSRGMPRLGVDGGFETPKQSRRGAKGAFGGPGARRVREDHMRRNNLRTFLVSVVCEDPSDGKSLEVRAASIKGLRALVEQRFTSEFPNATIKDIIVQ